LEKVINEIEQSIESEKSWQCHPYKISDASLFRCSVLATLYIYDYQ